MNLTQVIIINVIASIIGYILIKLFSSVTKNFGDYLIERLKIISKKYFDNIVLKLAKNNDTFINLLPSFIMIYGAIIFMSLVILNTNNNIDYYQFVFENTENIKNISDEEIIKMEKIFKINELRENLFFNYNYPNILISLKYIFLIIGIIIFFNFIYKMAVYKYVKSYNKAFENKMIILSIDNEPKKILEFKKRWITMKNSKDYSELLKDTGGLKELI